MGTRNLTAVYIDGTHKVAKYCQWDGYPSGQGITALNILRETPIDDLKAGARRSRWVSDQEFEDALVECGAERGAQFINMEVSDRFKERYPQYARDTGAAILDLMVKVEDGLASVDSINFAADGLFCEWAYVVDLDAGVFEVYEGFKKKDESVTGRFANTPAPDSEYAPVTLVATWPLSELPSDEEFLEMLEEKEEEDA